MYFPPIKDLGQITKDPTLKAVKPWRMILLGAAILYLVPAQLVLGVPVLGSAIDWLASLVPSIARWVELSPFPYNTKLFAVFVWMMIPLQVYWLAASVEVRIFFQKSYLSKSAQQSVFIRLVALLGIFVVLVGVMLLAFNLAIVDTPPCKVCVNASRWAQLFIGATYSLAFSGLIVFFSLSSYLFFRILNSKGNHHG